MKINRRSWHYRLLRLADFWPSDNLCPYCRQVIGALSLALFAAVMASAVVFVALGPIGQFFVSDGVNWAISGGIVDVGVLLMLLHALVKERRRRERLAAPRRYVEPEDYEPEQTKEPGLLRLWLRAQHDKICPTLDFV